MKDKTNPLHVAIVIDSIKQGGGAEKNAARLATLFAKEGYQAILLTFSTYTDEYAYTCPRVTFGDESSKFFVVKIFKAIQRLIKIKNFCKNNGITHIVSFLEKANTYTLLASILLGNQPNLIISVRADPTFTSTFKKWIIKILYKRAYTVVAVSRTMELILQKDFGLTNTTTIYNPVDTKSIAEQLQYPLPAEYQYLETEDRGPIFVNVGRLCDQKGQIHLVRSFAKVVAKYPNSLLIIIGEGPMRLELEQAIQEQYLDKNILLVGKQDNIYPFLRVANCFVLPSLYEGFPNVLLEAAASGLYIISTDCRTGPREILAPEIDVNLTLQYPYRVIGGSLLPDFAEVDLSQDMKGTLSDEMLWFAGSKKAVKVARVSGSNFSKGIFLEKWIQLLS